MHAMWQTVLLTCLSAAAAKPMTFDTFMKRFDKVYASEAEQLMRRQIFNENVAHIMKHNSKDKFYKLGVNEFSDLTNDEFEGQLFGYDSGASNMTNSSNFTTLTSFLGDQPLQKLPPSVDWREKGAVTPVKTQGPCGACWTFSATGALEGAVKVVTGRLISFSEEQFVDCATQQYGNLGCRGGKPSNAFIYARDRGLCSEQAYPYAPAPNGRPCVDRRCPAVLPRGIVKGVVQVPKTEEALMVALTRAPVSIAVESQDALRHYAGGVLTAICGKKLNHAILAVGYGQENDLKYWIVKNSWGTTWGEQGFARLVRGQDECGILDVAVMPILRRPADGDIVV